MTSAPMHDTNTLLQLVERKHACLVQLLELGQRQCAVIDTHDLTTLLQVLSVKQQLVVDLQQTEQALDPFRQQQPNERRWANEQKQAHCRTLIEQSAAMFAALLRLEKQAEQQLQARRNETAARLAELNSTRQVRASYTTFPSAAGRQLDLHTS